MDEINPIGESRYPAAPDPEGVEPRDERPAAEQGPNLDDDPQGPGSEELPPLGNVAEGVRTIISAAEETAKALMEDARAEARRKVEDTQKRLEQLWRERSTQIGDLTESVAAQGRELQSQIEQLRAQARSLSDSMSRAVESLRSEFGEPEAPSEPPSAPEVPEGDDAPATRWNDSELAFESQPQSDEAEEDVSPVRRWFGMGARPQD